MNSQNFNLVKIFIRGFLFLTASFVHVQVKAWEVDMSRRQKELKSIRTPASIEDFSQSAEKPGSSLLGNSVFQATEPSQDIVILNTDRGFVPETIRLKKGNSYRFYVVNVNDKEKNTSFILDAFSEHHSTFFGRKASFLVSPKVEGVFSFQCPETSAQGRITVFSDSERKPASK